MDLKEDSALEAVLEELRKRKDRLKKKISQIEETISATESIEAEIAEKRKIYWLVIIRKPGWAQSESQRHIRVLSGGNLLKTIKSAKDLYKEIYSCDYKPGNSSYRQPATIGAFIPFRGNASISNITQWPDLFMMGELPSVGDRFSLFLLKSDGPEQEFWQSGIKDSEFIELPAAAYSEVLNN
ncbi:MAG: hypothetical protein PHG23_00920 [Candidatus Pacebacteria bacterium]|nr:hypothetical protein [Candidatus Paceibacterota bacterium]